MTGMSVDWDEAARPTAGPAGPPAGPRGEAVGRHLVEVHDHLRGEVARVGDVLEQVRAGAVGVGAARAAVQQMALRANAWTLGSFCHGLCRVLTGHHTLESDGIFPHLRDRERALAPVLDRLHQEHEVIHRLLDGLDSALVTLAAAPDDLAGVHAAFDTLRAALLSHFAYEEAELVGPLARHGMWPGQV